MVLTIACAFGVALAVPAVKGAWEKKLVRTQIETGNGREEPGTPLSPESIAANEVAPFKALHLVPQETAGWSICIAEFTGFGPKAESTIPLVLPSIYPVTHLAINDEGPVYYAITTHDVGRIIPATGKFVELEPDPAIGKPSWPCAIAYDFRQGLLFIAARSQGYSYKPSTGEWKSCLVSKDDGLVGLVCASKDEALYGLRSKEGGRATKLIRISLNGAMLGQTDLSQPIPVGDYPFPLAQLCWSGERLVVLVSPSKREASRAPSRLAATMYTIEPESGLCRLVSSKGPVILEEVPQEQ
jgi:hypothetical protein